MTETVLIEELNLNDSPIFEQPDEWQDLARFDDPVREVCKLRELGEVVEGQGMRFGHVTLSDIAVPPHYEAQPTFIAISWDAAHEVYTDTRRFSSSHLMESIGQMWGPGIFGMDPPEHTKYRAHLQLAFMPKLVKQWEDNIIEPMLAARFSAIRPLGKTNLTRALTAYFPYEILGTIAGFDPTDIGFVAECFKKIQRMKVDPMAAIEGAEGIKNYALRIINLRRSDPQEDLVSALANAEVDGERLDDAHAVALLVHLLQGGIDTIYKMSSTLAYLLLEHPEQLALLRQDRSLVGPAIEEGLRYEGVANMMSRVALEDTEVRGTKIPKGSVVWLVNGVVNRDPARWDDPHRFDITRKPIAHMAFGRGAHVCIGMHLGRIELAHFLNHLMDDLPGLRWDSALSKPPRITGWFMRSALDLPVEWDVT